MLCSTEFSLLTNNLVTQAAGPDLVMKGPSESEMKGPKNLTYVEASVSLQKPLISIYIEHIAMDAYICSQFDLPHELYLVHYPEI